MVIDKDIDIHTIVRFVPKIIENETRRSSSIKKSSVWVNIQKRNETKKLNFKNFETKKRLVRVKKNILKAKRKKSWTQKFPKQAKSSFLEKKFVSKTKRSISVIFY